MDTPKSSGREEVVNLLTNAPEGRPLPPIYLLDDEEAPTMRLTAFALKHRAGGLVAVLSSREVRGLVSGFAEEAMEHPFELSEADVACETPRRRAVGPVTLLLVDVPWAGLGRLFGLLQHPKKRQRKIIAGTFLGANVDGLSGLVSAPRHRIGVLMRLTCAVARRGCCSADLLSSLLGLWIHVLMFRRPVLAVLQSVFSDARRVPRSSIFQLQRDSINELLVPCALAPLIQADLI